MLEETKIPFNNQAEQLLLGALILNNDNIDKVSDILQAYHFYNPAHKSIYEWTIKLRERSRTINPMNLAPMLKDVEMPDGVKMQDYLIQLASVSSLIVSVKDLALTIFNLSMRRSLLEIHNANLLQALDESNDKDPAELIEDVEKDLFQLSSQGQIESRVMDMRQGLHKVLAQYDKAKKAGGKIIGIPTGFTDLDNVLSGLKPGNLIILAGNTGMGKTAFGINIAANVSSYFYNIHKKDPSAEKKSVAMFSLEMEGEEIYRRILSYKSDVPAKKIINGSVSPEGFIAMSRKVTEIEREGMIVDDTPALSISALRTRARRMVINHNIGLLVVDYLQLLQGSKRSYGSNRTEEIAEVSRGLKAVAKELKIPVIALAQLSRKVSDRDNHRPKLSDLRESGSIEQDADVVMFIHREEYYLRQNMPSEKEAMYKHLEDIEAFTNKAEVIIGKQREGELANIPLHFEGSTTKFSNYMELTNV